jgi:hypothetical protein
LKEWATCVLTPKRQKKARYGERAESILGGE